MITPQYVLPLAPKLVVDLFAGGGGASTGIEQAIGRHVDIAVNHDPEAVALHRANHPQTLHYCCDVFEVDPLEVTEGREVGLLWASPDCKHFSKAKGGKPRSKKIRALADVIAEWAEAVQPDVICMENVEEFKDWGELDDEGQPIPELKGLLFEAWKRRILAQGYVGEFRELRACDYGTPTIRKRLFGIFRRDGQPIIWPKPTHAQKPEKGSGLKPWRTAAECIDWSIPCRSIFERDRPLAEATMRRIAHGVKRYVLDNPKPFIVGAGGPVYSGKPRSVDSPVGTVPAENHRALVTPVVARIGQTGGNGKYANSPLEPITTITSKAEHLLVSPTLVQTGYGERPGQAPRVPGLDKPLGTAVDGQKHALVAAFLAQHNNHQGVGVNVGHSVEKPISTIVGKGCTQSLVTSNLVKLRGTSNSAATDVPLGTVSAGGQHHAEVRAFLIRYFGSDQDPRIDGPLHTVTTKHRDAVVTVEINGEPYEIADIGMRMLQPRELYRAQGFPESYLIDRGLDATGHWITLTKAAQVRMCGNSVCPPLACAIVEANFVEIEARAAA